MNQAEQELYNALSTELSWNKARLVCFIKMLMALFFVKTINLTAIAVAMNSTAKLASRYKRVCRFFGLFEIDMVAVARFIFKWFLLDEQKVHLIIDRTNWKLGSKNINVLMLSVVYGGISIPLFWENLGRAGNSNTDQRIKLIQRYINAFGAEGVASLLGDREFIGKVWFRYLLDNGIHFYIRLKSDTKLPNAKGKLVKAKYLFQSVACGEMKLIRDCEVWGLKLSLAVTREAGDLLKIIVTDNHPSDALAVYQLRQNIETLFGCLKTRGYRFEDTHLTDPAKINKLLVLLAIGFCWAYKMGEWKNENIEAIKIKAHGRRSVSIFRYGLDFLRDTFLKLHDHYEDFKQCIKKLQTKKRPKLRMVTGGRL